MSKIKQKCVSQKIDLFVLTLFLGIAPLSAAEFQSELQTPLSLPIIERIEGKSWNEECPIPLADLAYITVSHWNQEGKILQGELICHKNLASEFVSIFEELFEAHYPIEKMQLIDDYNADDELSMQANNSSAFCSRTVVGYLNIFSEHSYGGAIDINPLVNPFIKGTLILPKEGASFTDRSQEIPGMIQEGDACYQAFIKRGYKWGGDWKKLKDYQHFEKPREQFIQ